MDGEEPWHVKVTVNMLCLLRQCFNSRPDFHVYSSAIRVRVNAANMLTYPDVVALCGEQRFEQL